MVEPFNKPNTYLMRIIMANLDALRKKLAKITRTGPVSRATWKPPEGDSVIRIVPIKSNLADLLVELRFYYLPSKVVFSPRNVGKHDPIFDFGMKLREGGNLSKDEWNATKKFFPATRTYLPVIVRGKEAEGVKWWGFGMEALKQIKGIIDDSDYGDIFDIENGYDLRINYTPKEKSAKKIPEVVVKPRKDSSPLTTNPEQFETWTANVPDLIGEWEVPSDEEMAQILEQLVDSTTTSAWDTDSSTALVGAIETIAGGAPEESSEKVAEINDSFTRAFDALKNQSK